MGEYADERRAQEDQALKSAYEPPELGGDEGELSNEDLARAFEQVTDDHEVRAIMLEEGAWLTQKFKRIAALLRARK